MSPPRKTLLFAFVDLKIQVADLLSEYWAETFRSKLKKK